MVRYHLRCKKSLLLLKRKFLLRIGDKKLFFLLNSCFYFILFGMVQAWVGQKHLNCFILRVFTHKHLHWSSLANFT
jgi:hypothetical protein